MNHLNPVMRDARSVLCLPFTACEEDIWNEFLEVIASWLLTQEALTTPKGSQTACV